MQFTYAEPLDPTNPRGALKPRQRYKVGHLVSSIQDSSYRMGVRTVRRYVFGFIRRLEDDHVVIRQLAPYKSVITSPTPEPMRAALDPDHISHTREAYRANSAAIPRNAEEFADYSVEVTVKKGTLTLINPHAPLLMDYLNKVRQLSRNRRGRLALAERLARWSQADARDDRYGEEGSRRLATHHRGKVLGLNVSREVATLLRAHTRFGVAGLLSRLSFLQQSSPVNLKTFQVLNQKFGLPVFMPDCNHAMLGTPTNVTRMIRSRVTSRSYCANCMQGMRNSTREVVAHDGTTSLYYASEFTLYEHSDGLWYRTQEGPIVAGYHSSKAIHTKALPHITGKPMSPFEVTIGYELEFTKAEGARGDQNHYARLLKRKFEERLKGVIPNGRKYATFEHDGSVWFEMVSGFGPLELHREVLLHILQGEGKDRHAFRGELNSHDGGACGFHVHLAKPTSLRHALKMVKFYHATVNRPLIEKVARRYATRFATIIPNKAVDHDEAVRDAWQAQAAELRRRPQLKAQYIKQAIRNINPQRYETLNFHNENTVEVRIFRGTLVPTTAVACLEFAYMSWLFARDMPASQMNTAPFVEFVNKPDHRHDTRYLRQYLASTNGGPAIPGVFLPRQKEDPQQKNLPLKKAKATVTTPPVRNDVNAAFIAGVRETARRLAIEEVDFGGPDDMGNTIQIRRPPQYRIDGRDAVAAYDTALRDPTPIRTFPEFAERTTRMLSAAFPTARNVAVDRLGYEDAFEARLTINGRVHATRITEAELQRDGYIRVMRVVVENIRIAITRDAPREPPRGGAITLPDDMPAWRLS